MAVGVKGHVTPVGVCLILFWLDVCIFSPRNTGFLGNIINESLQYFGLGVQ